MAPKESLPVATHLEKHFYQQVTVFATFLFAMSMPICLGKVNIIILFFSFQQVNDNHVEYLGAEVSQAIVQALVAKQSMHSPLLQNSK